MEGESAGSPIEEKFWTAKEWAMKTRLPYRSILAAAARGELVAVRPSGTRHGAILISETSWSAWIERSRLRAHVRGRLEPSATSSRPASVRDLALR
jgi:hypothetical protein